MAQLVACDYCGLRYWRLRKCIDRYKTQTGVVIEDYQYSFFKDRLAIHEITVCTGCNFPLDEFYTTKVNEYDVTR